MHFETIWSNEILVSKNKQFGGGESAGRPKENTLLSFSAVSCFYYTFILFVFFFCVSELPSINAKSEGIREFMNWGGFVGRHP